MKLSEMTLEKIRKLKEIYYISVNMYERDCSSPYEVCETDNTCFLGLKGILIADDNNIIGIISYNRCWSTKKEAEEALLERNY